MSYKGKCLWAAGCADKRTCNTIGSCAAKQTNEAVHKHRIDMAFKKKNYSQTEAQVQATKENFCIWLLKGMQRTIRLYIKDVVGKDTASWFDQQVQYMIDTIKAQQDERKRG